MTKGCGCGLNSGHDGHLAPSKSRKDLANWKWVSLGSTRAKCTNNDRPEQRQWQRPNDNTDNRTLDETEDHADSESEGDHIHSDASEEMTLPSFYITV